MKQWFVLGLAAVGAYVVYQWWTNRVSISTAGQNANPGVQQPNPLDFNLTYPGVTSDNGLVSGVPAFDATAIEAGHGDQTAASKQDNTLSTMSGPYAIPFGPSANQGGTAVY